MARSYAQFSTSMWRNADFLALPSALQRVYMLLSSQADVSAVGVLHLSVTRWAGRAPDTTVADINWALDGLAERRFIILDRDSEEVLLRAFLRWDNGYKNPKRLPAIKDAANEIESPLIVGALAAEFARVNVAQVYRGQCLAPSGPTSAPDDPDSAFPQVDSLSIAYPENQEGVSASERRVPQPTTRNPQPVPPPADGADASSQQTTLDGMPEPEEPAETPEQIGYRLARRWKKIREDAGKPIIARGKGRDREIFPLKNLIEGAVSTGYTEDEINQTLERCNQGVPTGSKFDQVLGEIRDERAAPGALVQYNAPHLGATSSRADRAPQQRSTGSLRAEQALDVAAELDREYANGGTR
jgi:hypothetical protein